MPFSSLLAGVLISSSVLLSSCKQRYSKDEVQRVLSPSGQVEAVVYETNGGATTSFSYEVDLQKVGDDKATDVVEIYGALRNEGAYGVDLMWSQPNSLHIRYLRAKSIVSSKSVAIVDGQQVTVYLDAGINDPSVPGGGMLHNLQKK